MVIRSPKDFWSAVLFIAFGAAVVAIAYNYPAGTASRMGPGYFPRALGFMIMGLGAILLLRSFRMQGAPLSFGSLKPLAIVLGSVVLFGMLVNSGGMVLSTIVLIITSSFASHEFRWKEAIIASVLLAAMVVGVFGYGLKLQLPIWPTFLVGN